MYQKTIFFIFKSSFCCGGEGEGLGEWKYNEHLYDGILVVLENELP